MTATEIREKIEAPVRSAMTLIDARFPGLRKSSPSVWTHKVARLLYEQRGDIGQKARDPNAPVSHDTLGWAPSGKVVAPPGTFVQGTPFYAIDLLDGTTLEIHFDIVRDEATGQPGLIGNQSFLVPALTDLTGNGQTGPPPPPPPTPRVPPRDVAFRALQKLDAYYSAPEGLQRPNGLSLNGKPDFEGVAAWYLDVFQNLWVAGKSFDESWAEVEKQIRQSDEWRQKHPRETP